jgi:hypothetical protein
MVGDAAGFFSQSSPELLLEVVTKTANSLLGEWAKQRQRWDSGGVAKN